MKTYSIKITGWGTAEEIHKALEELAEDILMTIDSPNNDPELISGGEILTVKIKESR